MDASGVLTLQLLPFFKFIFCIFISTVHAEWNTNDYLKREHSLVKPYQGSGVGLSHWDFGGSTMLTTSFIRLTADRQSLSGSLWNTMPCYIHNWEMQVQFKVHGSGKDLYGDGFAVWYSRDRLKDGHVFGNTDYFYGLGIFVDTYSNHNGPHNHDHPYVSAMINNGTLSYDHDKDGTLTQIDGCSLKLRNLDIDTYLSIRYLDNVLTVSTDISGKGAWNICFTVEGVYLPTGYYFGASSATGDLADNHDIISMKLYELESPNPPTDNIDYTKVLPHAQHQEEIRERHEDTRNSSKWSRWQLFFVFVLAVIGVGVCASVSYIIFQNKQATSRKRFY